MTQASASVLGADGVAAGLVVEVVDGMRISLSGSSTECLSSESL